MGYFIGIDEDELKITNNIDGKNVKITPGGGVTPGIIELDGIVDITDGIKSGVQVVSSSGSSTVIIKVPDITSNSSLYFGDATSDSTGRIVYDHDADTMKFFVNDTQQMTINENGNLTITGTVDGVEIAAHNHGGAGQGGTVSFASLGSKPTTHAGYGITDSHTFASITSKPTTIAGYGITDGLTDGDFSTAGFMKTDGSGNYSVNENGENQGITVVTCVAFYEEAGYLNVDMKTKTINVSNGIITGYGSESAWTNVGSWEIP